MAAIQHPAQNSEIDSALSEESSVPPEEITNDMISNINPLDIHLVSRVKLFYVLVN